MVKSMLSVFCRRQKNPQHALRFGKNDPKAHTISAIFRRFCIAQHIEGGGSLFGFFLIQKLFSIMNKEDDIMFAQYLQRTETIEQGIQVFSEIIRKKQRFGDARVQSSQGSGFSAIYFGDKNLGRVCGSVGYSFHIAVFQSIFTKFL